MNKSPLRPPTNRSFSALKPLRDLIPPRSVVNSFLLLDGTIELNLAKSDRFVVGHTNKYVVYEFWKCILAYPERVAEFAEYLFPIENKNMFEVYQDRFAHFKDPFVRAATFYALNQCSDSALISSGHLKNTDYDPLSMSYLKTFSPRNFNVKFDKEENIIESLKGVDKDEYTILPIGRYSSNLFEQGRSTGLEETKVYHKAVRDFFRTTDQKIALLYYAAPPIFKWYEDFNIRMINEWGIETTEQESCREVIIANF